MTATIEEQPTLVDEGPDTAPGIPAGEVPEVAEPVNARRAHARAREGLTRFFRSRPVGWVTSLLVPPDFVRDPQPPLRAVWRHAIWGEQIPPGSPMRAAYVVAWLVLCSPWVTLGYLLAWWHARLSRVAVGYLTFWALWQIPPVRMVLTAWWDMLTAPLGWFITHVWGGA